MAGRPGKNESPRGMELPLCPQKQLFEIKIKTLSFEQRAANTSCFLKTLAMNK